MGEAPQVQRGAHGAPSSYALEAILRMTPSSYQRWVYDPRTPKVDRVPLFLSPRLDRFFLRAPWWLAYLLWAPLIALGLQRLGLLASTGRALEAGIGFALGFALWVPVELLLHRVLFHAPVRSPSQIRLHLLLHGHHHLAPGDRSRLAAHPLQSGALLLLVFGLARLAGADPWVPTAGFALHYLRYEASHYLAHHARYRTLRRIPLLGGFLIRVKKNHLHHHYKAPDERFPISFYWT